MKEQLTEPQKQKVVEASRLIMQASALLDGIDEEIQSVGSTGENPINHTAWDLQNTASYISHWVHEGVEL